MTSATEIYEKYLRHYDGEIQGCCPLIADEIHRAVGGEVVAGYLLWPGCQRSHWWVEKDGQVLDPMGDELLKHETWGDREEAHRDRSTFEAILPDYERWRVSSTPDRPQEQEGGEAVNAGQIELARHALGLPNRRRQTYRNHFVTGEGAEDHARWTEMAASGWAVRRKGGPLTGGDDLFMLTRTGAQLALRRGERLDPKDFPTPPRAEREG